MDLRVDPISLVTLGKAFPEAGLQGSGSGTVSLQGPLGAVAVSGELTLPGGGTITGGGSLDLESAAFAYDLELGMQGVDLAAVTTRVGESTDLSGNLRARGRGTDPATLTSVVQADLVGSRIGDLPADEVHLGVDVADGVARFAPSFVRLETAEARVQGSFGLVEGKSGVLTYDVRVDSLHTLAPWLPPADTGLVAPRAGARAQARADARAELARAMRAVEVERMATGVAPPEPSAADTLPPPTLPRDSLAGSIRASGELRGNLARFDAQGVAEVQNLVYQGSAVASGSAEYDVTDVRTPTPNATVSASARSVLFRGLAYDSLNVEGSYAGGRVGSGRADVTAWQDADTELRGTTAFTFAEADRELRLEELRLRVDTVTWTNAGVGVIRWADRNTEIHGLELVGSTGGRVRVDGSVPAEGEADLSLLVEDVEVAHVEAFLQDDLGASGRLSLDGRLRGTRVSPSFEGSASWLGAALRGTSVPDARGTVSYSNSELAADLELFADARRLAVARARLPINLALTDVEGSRLLNAALSVEVTADSLPLEGLAGLTTQIANVQGAVRGDFRITGTFEEPVLEGGGEILGGALEVPALGVPFTDIAGSLSLSGDVVRVDSLVAWARGPIRVTGQIDVATLAEPRFDLLVTAREARVLNNDDGRLDIDADLAVLGPFDSVSVVGAARTRKGVVYIPQLSELGVTDVVALDDPGTFERVDTLLAARRDLLLSSHPFIQNLNVDLWVAIDRDVWLRSIEANVEIYTPWELGPMRVRVDGSRRKLLLEGTINTDRGEYEFMTRNFRLTRGAVTFLGGEELDAILQVAAEHEVLVPSIQPFEIRALISGTLRAPTFTLESSAQPPIPQTDLLTYVVFGRQASNLLPIQGSALSGRGAASGDLAGNVAALATQQISTAAFGTLVNDLEGEAARSLGVDVFRITPADLPEELFDGKFQAVLQGTEIEVGKYVSPRVFLAAQTRAYRSRLGLTAEYVAPRGFRGLVSWQPRFLPTQPTLSEEQATTTNVLGLFIFRDWRF
jgi:translocation and assembly module TamB